jgi:hypothetical protein
MLGFPKPLHSGLCLGLAEEGRPLDYVENAGVGGTVGADFEDIVEPDVAPVQRFFEHPAFDANPVGDREVVEPLVGQTKKPIRRCV